MLVLDRGGAAAAADDVNDGGLSYGDDNDDDVDVKEWSAVTAAAVAA